MRMKSNYKIAIAHLQARMLIDPKFDPYEFLDSMIARFVRLNEEFKIARNTGISNDEIDIWATNLFIREARGTKVILKQIENGLRALIVRN